VFDDETAVVESESDGEEIQREGVRGHQRVLPWQTTWPGATRKERCGIELPSVM
jgi:hypothetical protein